MDIKANQIIALTKGEYSDYCLVGHVRALVDFNAIETRHKFIALLTDEQRDCPYSLEHEYTAWLIREALVEPMPSDVVVELYIEDFYGGVNG